MLWAAVLAWDCSRLTARGIGGVTEVDTDIVISAHALPGCKERIVRTIRADEPVKKLFSIFNIHMKARAMIPVLTATITVDHHAMIIWATADTIFPSIIGFII